MKEFLSSIFLSSDRMNRYEFGSNQFPVLSCRPGLSSILTGYLPSVILNGFIYLIPYAMLGMTSLEGSVSKSKKEIKTCNMVFYFLVGNVFFLSVLSGSLLDQIGESFTNPKHFPSRLARAVSAQVNLGSFYVL